MISRMETEQPLSPATRWLAGAFGLTSYSVPLDRGDEFGELVRRLEAIYSTTALSWSVWRNRTELEEWVESAPKFRERADLERAAAVLDREPEIVQTLESLLTAQ